MCRGWAISTDLWIREDSGTEASYISLSALLVWSSRPVHAPGHLAPPHLCDHPLPPSGLYLVITPLHTCVTTPLPPGLYLVITYLVAKMIEELVINWIASLGVSAMLFYGKGGWGGWIDL